MGKRWSFYHSTWIIYNGKRWSFHHSTWIIQWEKVVIHHSTWIIQWKRWWFHHSKWIIYNGKRWSFQVEHIQWEKVATTGLCWWRGRKEGERLNGGRLFISCFCTMWRDQNWITVAEKNDPYWSARWFSACVRACVRACLCVCFMQVLLFGYVVWIPCSQYHCHFPLVLSQISGFMFKSDFCTAHRSLYLC